MNILVIDAQGGGIGKQLITAIKNNLSDVVITAVGTNSAATSAMLKAGADKAATGDNAIAVGQSSAKRILIPINHCDNIVVGVQDLSISTLVQEVVKEIQSIVDNQPT